MKEPLEARIVLKRRSDGKTEILCWDPLNLREIRTGMTVPSHDDRQVAGEVRKLREVLEKAGNRVTVIEK